MYPYDQAAASAALALGQAMVDTGSSPVEGLTAPAELAANRLLNCGNFVCYVWPVPVAQVRKTPSWPRIWANFSLYCCITTGIHGPTCIFWANLTPPSLQPVARGRRDLARVWPGRPVVLGLDMAQPGVCDKTKVGLRSKI